MADSKITALTALTAADPANDMIPIVDVSDTPPASGNTKRISINNILACSPSATLASATISGALDAARLNVTGATIPANGVYLGSANNLSFSAASTLGMTLNSTGLGVGISPAVNLDIASASTTQFRIQRSGQADVRVISDTGVGVVGTYSNHTLRIRTNGADAIICDTAQNVGVGVTPSAGRGAIQLSAGVGFPATQVASSDANTLDDYEEGTWVGTLKGGTADPTTPVTATGRYTKIGRVVSVNIEFRNVSTVGASGVVYISGLPFTNNSTYRSVGSAMIGPGATFSQALCSNIDDNDISITFRNSATGASFSNALHDAGTGRSFFTNVTYTV
jgi:hypothetical protein